METNFIQWKCSPAVGISLGQAIGQGWEARGREPYLPASSSTRCERPFITGRMGAIQARPYPERICLTIDDDMVSVRLRPSRISVKVRAVKLKFA